MKHAVVNLGCKVNRVEADSYERLLQAAGSLPGTEADADIVVVNTCTVTGDAEKKTRKAVRHVLRENAKAPVIVTGCAAAIDPSEFTTMDKRVVVVPKAQMEAFLADALARREVRVSACDVRLGRQRIGVKVQDGCDNACAYCIVHTARGPAFSCDEETVVAESMRLAHEGVREIVLTGINLGAYGREGKGRSLAELLERLLAETASILDEDGMPCRFRLSSIEPTDMSEALLTTIAGADGRVCRHLHLPLQSGSPKVLEEMGRPYTACDFERLAIEVRKRIPSIALSTDVIVGFPGETERDFTETMELCRACGFSLIHVFPYSRRVGTPAASRSDQVDPQTKAARAARLRDLARELREADRRRRAGTVELVLVEQPGHGITESYHEAAVDTTARSGSLVSYRFAEPGNRI